MQEQLQWKDPCCRFLPLTQLNSLPTASLQLMQQNALHSFHFGKEGLCRNFPLTQLNCFYATNALHNFHFGKEGLYRNFPPTHSTPSPCRLLLMQLMQLLPCNNMHCTVFILAREGLCRKNLMHNFHFGKEGLWTNFPLTQLNSLPTASPELMQLLPSKCTAQFSFWQGQDCAGTTSCIFPISQSSTFCRAEHSMAHTAHRTVETGCSVRR